MSTASMMPTLADWLATWSALGAAPDEGLVGLYAGVIDRYREPHRHYHTTEHLDECFGHWAVLRPLAVHPAEVELALWFHDAVYEVRREDNEARSADWVRTEALARGIAEAAAERIHALVMATGHSAEPDTDDARLLVDVDLSILGAAPARYDAYERQIRQEYAWVPEAQFRARRVEILESFLARACIYHTPEHRRRYEHPARANMFRAVSRLKQTP